MEAVVKARVVLIALALAVVAAPLTGEAKTGGCLKYGAAGAVAGHFAHHHAVAGAVAGCAVGAWKRHEANKHSGY